MHHRELGAGLILVAVLLIGAAAETTHAEELIVYTANQEFLSRIYLLRMDGSVERFFEYDFYHFVDTEVVGGELYVADAFAPRVYRVDVATGALDVIIDDWSLYYFYGLAWDGTYFYVDEWDLNRYTVDGHYSGRASFDETVYGSTHDGTYLWTLDDEHPVRCWDISQWPAVTALPENDFPAPSPNCRGLWFDGTHFWTAESGDTIGHIYQFAYGGEVVQQWWEPAYSGWSAGLVPDPASGAGEPPALQLAGAELRLLGNPGRSAVSIELHLPTAERIELQLYGLRGESRGLLAEGCLPAGTHRLQSRLTALPTGVYFLRLLTPSADLSRKLLVTR